MLTADSNLEIRFGLATSLGSDLHQLSDTFLVEYFERITCQDALVDIDWKEFTGVVS